MAGGKEEKGDLVMSETVKNNEEVFTSPEELVKFLNRADDDTIVNVSVEIKGSGVVAGGDGYG